MAQNTYTVTAPNGKILSITGDQPPTEQELDEIFEKANVQADSKTIAPTPEQQRRGYMYGPEDFIDPKDRNIFNQDVSTSLAQGVGGLFSGAKNLVTGGYHAVVDPLQQGYEEGGATGTLGALLKTPYSLVASATEARRDLLERAKTAESLPEKIGYNITGRIPFLGPAIAAAGEQLGSGRPETMGEGVFNALAVLQASPSFRAMTAAGKAKAIAAIKSGTSKIPIPPVVKTTLGKVGEHPGLALAGGIEGYMHYGTLGAVAGAIGVPSGYGSLRGFFRSTPAEIAEKRAYAKEQVAERNTRADTIRATRRQEKLADDLSKVGSTKERDILLDAQKDARAQAKRESDSIINARKIARENELLENASSEKKAIAEDKSTEAKRIREDRKAIVERHRAEDRGFKESDLIDSNTREDIHIADRVAAQDLRIHEANIKEQARATDLRSAREAANKTKRDIAYSKILTQKQKNALLAESNKATAAKQAELRRGMVGEPPIVRESTRLKRDGVTTTTNQRFNYPEELIPEVLPVVDAGQASIVQEVPGSVVRQPRVKKAAIFEEMDNRASMEQAGMFPNRMGAKLPELLQDIARDRENGITEWTGVDGRPTSVDPRIAEAKRLIEIMTGEMSPAYGQGLFAAGGTGNFGAKK